MGYTIGVHKRSSEDSFFNPNKVGKDTVRRNECKHCALGGGVGIISKLLILNSFSFNIF